MRGMVFMNNRHKLLLLGGLFALALGLRTLYLYQVSPSPFTQVPIIDALDEDEWGQQIAAGDWLGKEKGVFYRDPLYAYALGLLYFLFGHDLMLAMAVQAVLDAVLCVLLFFIARSVFNSRVGAITAVLAALYGPFVFHQGLIMKTSLTMLLLALFLFFLLRSFGEASAGTWYLTGIFLGLAITTRSNSLIFLPLVLAAALLPTKREIGRNIRIFTAVFFFAGLLTILLPLAVRNKIYGQSLTFSVPSAGLNFYHGNSPGASGVHTRIKGVRTIPEHEWEDSLRIASLESGRSLLPSEVSSFWLKKGWSFIRENPRHFLSLLWRKTLLFWNHYEVPDVYNYEYFKEESSVLSLLITFGIVGPLGIAGMFFAMAKKQKRSSLLIAFVLLYMLSVIAFYVTSRYRLPVVLFLLPFSAFAINSLWEYFKSRNGKMLVICLLVLFLSALFVNVNLLDAEKFLSQSHSLLGNIHHSNQELDEAATEYREALAIDKNNHEAANNLAYTYLEKGENLDEALEWSLWSVGIYPYSPESLDTLFKIYLKFGMVDSAREILGKAITLDPANEGLRLQMRELDTLRQPPVPETPQKDEPRE